MTDKKKTKKTVNKSKNSESKQTPEVSQSKEVVHVTKPPDQERLNYIAKQIMEKLVRKKMAIYEIGQLLCEAKKDLSHGEFQKWVEENFGEEFSYQSAYNYMRVYFCCGGRPELVNYFPTPLLYNIVSAGFPEQLRNFIFEHAKRFDKYVSVKQVKEIAEKVKEDGFDSEDENVQRLLVEVKGEERRWLYVDKMDRDLKEIASKWDDFESAAKTGLASIDGEIMLTPKQEQMPIVGIMKKLGLMPDYRLLVEQEE